MKVLQIGKYYPPKRGGIERVLEVLAQGLSPKTQLEVLCFHDRRESVSEEVEGVLVHRMACWETFFSVPVAPGMYFWMQDRCYDIVHLHTPNPLAELLYLMARPKGKLVVTYHADPQKARGLLRLYQPVARRVLEAAEAICVATPKHIQPDSLLDDYRSKCRVIPFGIDLSTFAAPDGEDPEALAWRERMGGDFFLFVGRLVPYKGLLSLFEAVRPTDLRLAIVGSGPLYANLQQLREGMEDRVQMLGNVSDADLPSLYRAARGFVLPSLDRSEAFGMVQIEAFASGTPSLSSDLPSGVSWVNQHEETGLLFPPGDVEALRRALLRVAGDDELHQRLKAGALSRAQQLFGKERYANLTLDLYRELNPEPSSP